MVRAIRFLKSVRLRRTSIPCLVLLSSLLLTVISTHYVASTLAAKEQLEFNGAVRQAQSEIQERITTYIALLRAGSGLFSASQRISRAEFRSFVARLELSKNYPGVQGIGFAARIKAPEKAALINEMKRQGLQNFRIRPDFERPEYYPIIYLEPQNRRNQAAIEFDMFTDPTRRAAMEKARDTSAPAASGRVTLKQEITPQKQAGFLIYMPVYRNRVVPDSVAERRTALFGFVYSPFRVGDFIQGILGDNQFPGIHFEIYDGTVLQPSHLLYRFESEQGKKLASHRSRLTETVMIDVGGRSWTLVARSPLTSYLDPEYQFIPLIAISGMLISLILFVVTRSQIQALIKAEESANQLQQSEIRFRTLIEQAPISIQILCRNGKTVQVNRAWEELWGLTLDQLEGYNMLEDPQLVEKGIMPYIQQGFAGKATAIPPIQYDPEETIPGRSSHAQPQRWVQAYIYPVKDEIGRIREVVLMHEDITESKQAAAELQESESRFRTLIETTFDGIVIHEKGVILDANQGAAAMFGYFLVEMIGQSVLQFVAESSRDLVLRNIRAGLEQPYEAIGQRKDGTTLNIEVIGRSQVYKGRNVRVTALRDITSRKQLEAQLRLRAEQLAEANRLKDEFLATLSHELRTPLNAMLGWTQMLVTRKLDEKTFARATETIDRNTRSLAQLIEDLLDVSRIIRGKLHLNVRPARLIPVIEAAIETVRTAAEAKNIQIKTNLDATAGTVLGDANRIQQVIWNLLSNAVKFTPNGGQIEIGLEKVEGEVREVEEDRLTASPSSSLYAQITVRDTGQGISRDFLPFVFERFRQADGSTTRTHGGLGLGLAIVRHLVELHGGKVSVDSPGIGQGTTFMVRLPLVAEAVMASSGFTQPITPDSKTPVYSISLTGLKVLVVEDDPDARELVLTVLTQYGAVVHTVATTSEALQELATFHPDVLISDIGLPGEDGYALIQKIRTLDERSGGKIPAIALTAYAKAEDRTRALLAGFQLHVPKPIDANELAIVVGNLAGRVVHLTTNPNQEMRDS